MIKQKSSVLVNTLTLASEEFNDIENLLLSHGPNQWNYLAQDSINMQFECIKRGQAKAIVAKDNAKIVGFAAILFANACPPELAKYTDLTQSAYIGDVVVNSAYSGKGLGSKLLEEAILQAKAKQLKTVLVERHEENLASAGMMRKAGFEIVETYFDPERRAVGSRNTVLSRYTI